MSELAYQPESWALWSAYMAFRLLNDGIPWATHLLNPGTGYSGRSHHLDFSVPEIVDSHIRPAIWSVRYLRRSRHLSIATLIRVL